MHVRRTLSILVSIHSTLDGSTMNLGPFWVVDQTCVEAAAAAATTIILILILLKPFFYTIFQ